MNRIYLAALAMAGICLAAPVWASFDQLMSVLQSNQQAIDSDHEAQDPVLKSLTANCNVNDALKAALSGDNKTFAKTLENAETNLEVVAKDLPAIASEKRFGKFVKLHVVGYPSEMRADKVLIAIAELARDSAEALSRIRAGQGGQEELSQVFRNNAAISQLILAFYSLGG